MTPLHKAVRAGSGDCIKVLVRFFAEVNACDCDGKSPLHYACQLGQEKIV